ncbi:MAG: C4-dicarboxylate ABC transporter substrate-binding protein [Pseudomonadota bacterium]
MTTSIDNIFNGFKLAAIASAVFCLPTNAGAQEVTLKSPDGSVNLTGDLIEFKDNAYIVSSKFGPLRVAGDKVECFGAACPGIQFLGQNGADALNGVEATQDGSVAWDVSLWGNRRAFTEHVEKLAELVSDQTDGKFTLNISYGGLSDSRDNLDGISAGSFEMAQFCAGYHPEKNPSITVLELPFLGVNSLEQEVELSKAVYSHPATKADLARWNATLLMPSPLPQYNIMGAGSLPTSLSDFTGLKVRASGGIGAAIQTLGADLVSMPATEVEAALKSGELNAVSFAPHAHMAFGTVDSGTWYTTNLNPGTVNCPVVVNSDALNELPTQFRVALLSSVDVALDHYIENYNGATMEAWDPTLDENGIVKLTVRDDIISSIRELVAEPAAAAWINDNAARGLPAQGLYDLVVGKIAASGGS